MIDKVPRINEESFRKALTGDATGLLAAFIWNESDNPDYWQHLHTTHTIYNLGGADHSHHAHTPLPEEAIALLREMYVLAKLLHS